MLVDADPCMSRKEDGRNCLNAAKTLHALAVYGDCVLRNALVVGDLLSYLKTVLQGKLGVRGPQAATDAGEDDEEFLKTLHKILFSILYTIVVYRSSKELWNLRVLIEMDMLPLLVEVLE